LGAAFAGAVRIAASLDTAAVLAQEVRVISFRKRAMNYRARLRNNDYIKISTRIAASVDTAAVLAQEVCVV